MTVGEVIKSLQRFKPELEFGIQVNLGDPVLTEFHSFAVGMPKPQEKKGQTSMDKEFYSEHKKGVMEADVLLKMGGQREEPKIHDYTDSSWGWSMMYVRKLNKDDNECQLFTALGIGLGIQVGDSVIIKMKSGKTGEFKIEKIDYKRDPVDMWDGTIKFVGYFES